MKGVTKTLMTNCSLSDIPVQNTFQRYSDGGSDLDSIVLSKIGQFCSSAHDTCMIVHFRDVT